MVVAVLPALYRVGIPSVVLGIAEGGPPFFSKSKRPHETTHNNRLGDPRCPLCFRAHLDRLSYWHRGLCLGGALMFLKKRCRLCLRVLLKTRFATSKHSRDGLRARCEECQDACLVMHGGPRPRRPKAPSETVEDIKAIEADIERRNQLSFARLRANREAAQS